MFAKFFIDRPIFANVIAIITMLIGFVALLKLPVEQYPEITPPTIRVSAVYPGANAGVLASTVAAPIEQQVNGVEHMLYMSSTSSSDGSYSLTVTFDIGTDLDDAQVLVQNRVALAAPLLPEEVERQGVSVKKQSTNIILVLSLISPDNKYDNLFLANYATLRLRDELSRVQGVGEVTVFGTANYSMRVWLDPAKLKIRGLTTQDVVSAIQEQNVQVAAGQIGQPPALDGQVFQYTVSVLGRLSSAEQFENIIIRTGEGGRLTLLKDVARVELGAQTYDQFNMNKGRPTANIGIYQLPGANALSVAEQVKAAMERLSESFPEGMTYEMPLDTTKFVEASIHEVYKTLFEAGLLVLVVIVVFLQDWRAMLVPATTVPVTIIGAFAAMAALGFTVNMLTMFGLVLAIGIVVDDAIVIVENAAHHIEQGHGPQARHHPGDVGSAGADHRHHVGVDVGVLAQRLPGRHHRTAVSPVRPDDCRHGADQCDQCHDAQAGSMCTLAAAAARTQEHLLSGVQRGVRNLRAGLRRGRSRAGAARGVGHAGLCRPAGSGSLVVLARADRLPAHRRSGVSVCQRATSGCRFATAHARGDGTHRSDSGRHAGCRGLDHDWRTVAPGFQQCTEHGDSVRDA